MIVSSNARSHDNQIGRDEWWTVCGEVKSNRLRFHKSERDEKDQNRLKLMVTIRTAKMDFGKESSKTSQENDIHIRHQAVRFYKEQSSNGWVGMKTNEEKLSIFTSSIGLISGLHRVRLQVMWEWHCLGLINYGWCTSAGILVSRCGQCWSWRGFIKHKWIAVRIHTGALIDRTMINERMQRIGLGIAKIAHRRSNKPSVAFHLRCVIQTYDCTR